MILKTDFISGQRNAAHDTHPGVTAVVRQEDGSARVEGMGNGLDIPERP